MQKFKNGQEVEVIIGGNTKDCWYIGQTRKGKHTVEDTLGTRHAVPDHTIKAEPITTYTPHTPKTFPKTLCWVKPKGFKFPCRLVSEIHSEVVQLGTDSITWDRLLENYEISTDGCETWQKAGAKVN